MYRTGPFNQLYRFTIELWDRSGTLVDDSVFSIQSRSSQGLKGLDIYDGRIYTLWNWTTTNNPEDRVTITQISDGSTISQTALTLDGSLNVVVTDGIAVIPTRIIILRASMVHFFDHDFTHISAEDFAHNVSSSRDIEATSEYIYIVDADGNIHTFRHDGSAASDLDIASTDLESLAIEGARLYGQNRAANSREILVYTLAESLTYQNLVPIQFDTTDFDSFLLPRHQHA